MLVAEFVFVQLTEFYLCYRIRIRKHKVFLLCLLGICVISFLHYYKALLNISLLQELSPSSNHLKTLKVFNGIFWGFPTTVFHSQQDFNRHRHLKVEMRVKEVLIVFYLTCPLSHLRLQHSSSCGLMNRFSTDSKSIYTESRLFCG